MSNFYPIMVMMLGVVVFILFFAAIVSLFQKEFRIFLSLLVFCGIMVALIYWFIHKGREEEYQSFKQNESENENTDDLKKFQELLPKVGNRLDIHFLTKYNNTYNIGYKGSGGQLQWLEIKPTAKFNTFDDLGKTGLVRIVIDEKREKSEFVREKNKTAHFIMNDGKETEGTYPVYVLYLSNKTALQSSTKTVPNGKYSKDVEEEIVVNP